MDPAGRTFRQHFEAGDATAQDWDRQLSSPFPEARFRPQIELRCADTASPSMALALCALVKGWFYDETALDAVEAAVGGWSHLEIVAAWEAGHRQGLGAPGPERRTLLEHARELVSLARLNPAEEPWLEPIRGLLAGGRSLGEIQAEQAVEDLPAALEVLAAQARCGRAYA